jgi:ATP-dependent Zn protease
MQHLRGPRRTTRRYKYAEGTQLVIDQEVSRILSEAGERAAAMLVERRGFP